MTQPHSHITDTQGDPFDPDVLVEQLRSYAHPTDAGVGMIAGLVGGAPHVADPSLAIDRVRAVVSALDVLQAERSAAAVADVLLAESAGGQDVARCAAGVMCMSRPHAVGDPGCDYVDMQL